LSALTAGESLLSVAAALAVLYAFGYVVGALLLDPADDEFGPGEAVIRTAAGLLLSTVGFLLCLVLSLPWFVLPAGLVAAALVLKRRRVFRRPHTRINLSWDRIAASTLALVFVSPILITCWYMGQGSYPPVFYNIDTAYAMEKVHAFVKTDVYPPESLSNIGIRRTYHYGTQAMAAVISRTSGLLPHHSMFLIVLPLLTAGVLASAFAVARHVSPATPRVVAVPLLLLSIPSLSNPFWDRFGAQLWSSDGLSLRSLIGDYGIWGVLSNEGPNVGADFVILASIAGIAAARLWGWGLPAFLIGSAILVKTPTGVALMAGFGLVECWRALRSKRLEPSREMIITASAFAVTAAAFFLIGFENNFQVEMAPFFHLQQMIDRNEIPGLILDVAWMLLPAAIVMTARPPDRDLRSVPLLLMAAAPIIVVNVTRLDNTRAGGGGTGDDWFQILHAVPFLAHAFVLSIASRRWNQLGRLRRAAFVTVLALTVAPVIATAADYSVLLLREPESGNDFVDNRSLAGALAAIPTQGTVIVTNDLRYPAGNFTRDYRQMQIPALFGHQAFAVNYAHEAVEERRELQELLQESEWSDRIADAARTNGWTHFLVRVDYRHPESIPLETVFMNRDYRVYSFGDQRK
jgi:hypothetical protein